MAHDLALSAAQGSEGAPDRSWSHADGEDLRTEGADATARLLVLLQSYPLR